MGVTTLKKYIFLNLLIFFSATKDKLFVAHDLLEGINNKWFAVSLQCSNLMQWGIDLHKSNQYIKQPMYNIFEYWCKISLLYGRNVWGCDTNFQKEIFMFNKSEMWRGNGPISGWGRKWTPPPPSTPCFSHTMSGQVAKPFYHSYIGFINCMYEPEKRYRRLQEGSYISRWSWWGGEGVTRVVEV